MGTLFGIAFGPDEIRVALHEKSFRGAGNVVLTVVGGAGGGYPLPAAAAVRAARELLDRNGFDPEEDAVAVTLPSAMLTARQLKFPFHARRQIDQALPYEFEARTPFAADDLVLSAAILGTADGQTEVLAAGGLRDDLARFLDRCREGGVDPDLLIPEVEAAAAGVTAGNGDDLLLLLDEGEATLVARRDGRAARFVSVPEPCTDTASVARIVAQFRTLIGEASGPVLVAGPEGAAEEVATLLPDRSVREAPLRDATGGTPLHAACHGAARALAGAIDAPLNLRRGPFTRRRSFGGSGVQAAIAGGLALLLLLAIGVAWIAEGVMLDRRYNDLTGRIRSAFTTAMPEVTRIVSEKTQLAAALADLRDRAAARGVGEGGGNFLDRFAALSAAAPEGVSLDLDQLTYDDGRFDLKGRTGSVGDVEKIAAAFRKIEWVSRVETRDVKDSVDPGKVGFGMTVEGNR